MEVVVVGQAQDDIQQGDTQRQQYYSPDTEYTYKSEGASSPFIATSAYDKQHVSTSSSVAPLVGYSVASSSNATPGSIVSTNPTALQASSSQSTLSVLSTQVPLVDRVFTSSPFVEPQRESSRANLEVRDTGFTQEVGMRDDHVHEAYYSQGVKWSNSQVRIANSADDVCHQDSNVVVLQGDHDDFLQNLKHNRSGVLGSQGIERNDSPARTRIQKKLVYPRELVSKMILKTELSLHKKLVCKKKLVS
ncbi:hypothetical protein V6N12_057998 [Hibiscus sabdariffa]|uniref:Uncharacterized protein n=1 Tax=Hibiscus sabdariffa TaxID=183260 RepID=A0ABR2AXK4_9ROSI